MKDIFLLAQGKKRRRRRRGGGNRHTHTSEYFFGSGNFKQEEREKPTPSKKMASYALFFSRRWTDRPPSLLLSLLHLLLYARPPLTPNCKARARQATASNRGRKKGGKRLLRPILGLCVRYMRGERGETSSFPLQNERSPSLRFMHTSCRYRQEEEGAKDLQTYSPNLRLLPPPPSPPPPGFPPLFLHPPPPLTK